MSVNSVNADGSLTKIAGSGSTDTSVLKGDFSVVESTSTATRAYSIGDCFIMETGQLVRATSAIAINDTIAIGTNVAATSVAELLADKVDKEQGKGLSTNDYDNTEKSKVASITDKASKVQGGTSGNLAGLDSNGDLIDANWSADKTTQSATGNPISISGLKSNQLAVNPIITLEPIQDLHGQSNPYPAGGGKNKLNMTDRSLSEAGWLVTDAQVVLPAGTYTFSWNFSGTVADGQILLLNNGSSIASPLFHVVNGLTTLTFTCSQDVDAITIWSNALGSYSKFQIESGESYTSYAPYENICPISGYDKVEVESCGKNICDEQWRQDDWDGRITSDRVAIQDNSRFLLNAGTTYYFYNSGYATIYWSAALLYHKNDTVYFSTIPWQSASTYTFTPTVDCYIALVFMKSDSGNISVSDVSNINFMVCENVLSDKSYVPYHKTTDLSESLWQTVYGGTHEVRTGKLTSTHKLGDLGDLSWGNFSTGVFRAYATTDAKMDVASHVCEIYTCTNNYNTMMATNNTFCIITSGSERRIFVHDDKYSDYATFAAAVTGVKYAYELATPFTIQLTPHEISLLNDYAYVSTNGTNIQLSYHLGEMASLSDVSQLGETVNELSEYAYKVNIPSTVFNFISANILTWTGCSIEIPANSLFELHVHLVYVNNAPLQLVISTLYNAANPYLLYYNSEAANGSINGRTFDSSLKLYIWARHDGAGKNFLTYDGWYSPIK